jgi:uncharacterized protein YbjT (DUF2867 family)
MMKILITTPGGVIGRRILRELLAPEFSVRIVSRNPLLLPKSIREQVQVFQGCTDSGKTLRQALEGVDAMFWCVPEGFQETSANSHCERFARAAFQAIRETGTPRLVAISASGLPGKARSGEHHAMEEILNNSGAAIRHLRCGWLMENLLRQVNSIREGGLISGSMPADIPIPFTAAADIADTALRRLVRADWDGIESTVVHGPEALSFTQAAALFERILRRPVQYQQEPSAEELVQADENYGSTGKITTPTTLAVWVRHEFAPLLRRLEKKNFNRLQSGSAHERANRELNLSEVC